jgi:hypothetical protein
MRVVRLFNLLVCLVQQWCDEFRYCSDVLNKLDNLGGGGYTNESECFCLAMDESSCTSDTDQLLIVFRGITRYFDVSKETLNVCTGTREDLNVCVCENIKEHEVPWTKLKVMTSDRPPSMTRNPFL